MFPKRILLVEDDVDTRDVTSLLLQHAGYTVIVAHDVSSGVAESASLGLGVILADMYLGHGQTGVSLIRSLRDSGSQIPMVLTSADEEACVAARKLNVMFLPKPYGRQALLSVVAMARMCGA